MSNAKKKVNPKTNDGKHRPYRNKGETVRRKEVPKDKDTRFGCNGSTDNDVSWYANSEFLLRDAASIPFNTPAGSSIDLRDANLDGTTFTVKDVSVPGVLSIRYQPAVGISQGGYSPVNIASRNIYSYVRHANSGHSNYDAPDLMLYLLGMDQLYSWYSFMCRAYGVLQLYSVRNRYMPEVLIRGMHLNFSNFLSNLADFRYYINVVAEKIGSMCVPSSMPYFWRHIWMNSGVYADSDSQKSQFYMYVPAGYYMYEPTKYQVGGCLAWNQIDVTAPLMTFADIRSIVDGMINAIITDEDMNIMSGDILKAYGPDGVMKVSRIPEDYIVVPSFSREVLSQIQNSYAVGNPDFDTGGDPYGHCDIVQDASGNILQSWRSVEWSASRQGSVDGAGVGAAKIINMYKDDVAPADVMVATRLTPVGVDFTPNADKKRFLVSVGSEIVQSYVIYYFYRDANDGGWKVDWTSFGSGWLLGKGVNFNYLPSAMSDALSMLDNFAYHPTIYIWNPLDGTSLVDPTKWELDRASFDADNYTVVHSTTLSKMHETALLSEFSVPQMGSFDVKTTG